MTETYVGAGVLQDQLLAAGDPEYRRIQLFDFNRLKLGAQDGNQFLDLISQDFGCGTKVRTSCLYGANLV